MHIFSLRLFNTNKNDPIQLSYAEDLSPLPFIARMSNSPSELLLFLSRTFVKHTERGTHQGCKEGEYIGWVHHKSNGMAGVIICDNEYDRRVAFNLLSKCMSEYETKNWDWSINDIDRKGMDNNLYKLLIEYQKPVNIDVILKITQNLESTKIILHQSIDKMLERGEKIDVLLDKTNDLSVTSKNFYKKSKKLNSWCNSCIIM